jgi:hypothetical protein
LSFFEVILDMARILPSLPVLRRERVVNRGSGHGTKVDGRSG